MTDEEGFHLQDLLASMESHTLEWEKNPAQGKTALHLLFQGAHNLKSGLAMVGFSKASSSVHSVETILDDVRRGKVPWSACLSEILLGIIDEVRAAVDDRIDREIEAALDTSEAPVAPEIKNEGTRLYRIDKLFRRGLEREDFEGLPIFEDIASVGRLVSIKPGYEEYAAGPEDSVISFTFETGLDAEQLTGVFYDPLILLGASAAVPESLPPLRILIVEDDSLLGAMLSKFLKDYGNCRVAADGQDGLDAFKQALADRTPFHLVILDLDVPRMPGDQVLKQLRAFEESQGIFGLDRSIVVINTINADTDQVFKSFRQQADGYFIKPLSMAGITQSIASVKGKLHFVLRRLQARQSRNT